MPTNHGKSGPFPTQVNAPQNIGRMGTTPTGDKLNVLSQQNPSQLLPNALSHLPISSSQSLYRSHSVTGNIVTQAKSATAAIATTPSSTALPVKSIKSIAIAKLEIKTWKIFFWFSNGSQKIKNTYTYEPVSLHNTKPHTIVEKFKEKRKKID